MDAGQRNTWLSLARQGDAWAITKLAENGLDRFGKPLAPQAPERAPMAAPVTSEIAVPTPKAAERAPDYNTMQTYVANGYDLIPLDGKRPIDSGWPGRHYDAATVLADSAKRRGNVGVRPKSDQFIIDVDVKGDAQGAASFKRLCELTGFDPRTAPRVLTGSGGWHYYLKKPRDSDIPKNNKEFPGIDFIGANIYQACAAGSVHQTGKLYQWDDTHPTLDKAPLAPAKMIEVLAAKKQKALANSSKGLLTRAQLKQALAVLPNCENGESWRELLYACKAVCPDGLPEFVEYSLRDVGRWPNAKADAEDVWNRADDRADGVTAATFFHRLKEAGHGELFPKKRVLHVLPWRECRVNGTPIASMHNARLCIKALNITCRYDTFHNKLLIGYSGDDVEHEIESVVGEVSDNAVIRLRQIISERFDFDPEDKPTNDAIISLALEHSFDPIADILDKAQGEWDGVPRLDRFAPDYLNTDDTPLNRALGRKHLIAAVARVRHPGCKYDTILVLESDEGWNKSSAIRVLAGDENFSDQSVLGQAGREVMEQLSGIWMHENPDLAGLSKAHVEDVKAFASRQVDIARKAYGRYVTKQPRHSIEWGTTNDSEYLQSQTGNRRFGCMAVRRAIDLEKLKRDRLQILGEAAHHEAQGESLTLDEKLWPDAREAQEQRRIADPWEDELAHIPPAYIVSKGTERRVASADLLRRVLGISPDRQTSHDGKRLARVMTRLGWERCKLGDKARGYKRAAPRAEGQGGGDDAIPF